MREKTVEIEINGTKHNVVMRRMTFGERNRLMEEATEVRFSGNVPQAKFNQRIWRESGVLKCIVSAPFAKTLEEVQNLDQEAGEALYSAFEELNGLSDKKNDKSSS